MLVKATQMTIRIFKVNARLVGPKIPTSKTDPVGANRRLSRANKQIEARYKRLKSSVIELFRTIPVTAVNAQDAYGYRYNFSAMRAAQFNEALQRLIDEILLDDTQPMNAGQFWMSVEVSDAYASGTVEAQQQLAAMSPLYAEQRSITDIIYSEPYLQRLSIANAATYGDWVGLSDAARNDLSQVIMNAIAVGANPRDIESDIATRVGVSESRAKNIAQSELTGILRKSQADEVQESKVLLGLNSALFWVSALLPTTRITHAQRSGNVYDPLEVADFYSRDGNKWRCHCAQTPCMLDANGNVLMLESSLDRVIGAKDKWMSAHKK